MQVENWGKVLRPRKKLHILDIGGDKKAHNLLAHLAK